MKPVVVVAGVGPLIGSAVARAFGAEGFRVALLARDPARLATRHAEMTARGIDAAPFVVDLADSAAIQKAVEQVRVWAGADPSSLVYNAFAVQTGLADQLDVAESRRAMMVNFLAATELTSLLAPAMRAAGTGSLLFTGGKAAIHPFAGMASLCAGKAALRIWALTLAEELAGTGVRVGTVAIHGRVAPGTAFDPDDIAAAFLRLHRGTKEGIERRTLIPRVKLSSGGSRLRLNIVRLLLNEERRQFVHTEGRVLRNMYLSRAGRSHLSA